MNATQNAHFTTRYLQETQYQPQRCLKINPKKDEPLEIPRSNPQSRNDNYRSKLGQLNPSTKPTNEPRNGSVGIRAARHVSAHPKNPETNRKIQGDSRKPADYSDYYSTRLRNARGRNSGRNFAKNDTVTRLFLREEVLPHPELLCDENDDVISYGNDATLYEPSIPNHLRYSGVNMDQQGRYEQAQEMKPNMYTHKSFKEEEEKRLSPMDVVFEDPSKRKLNTRQKMKQALKQAKNKLGIIDYMDYTYHRDPINSDVPESLAVKKSEYSDSELDDNYANVIDDIFENEGDVYTERAQEKSPGLAAAVLPSTSKSSSSSSSSSPPSLSFKSQIRQKLRITKNSFKANGQYPFNGDGKFSTEPSSRSFQYADEIDNYETMAASSHINQADNFHPLWKYMLSWLVYENDLETEYLEPGKITELEPEIKHGFEERPGYTPKSCDQTVLYEKKGSRKDKHRTIFLNWSKPASSYISGKELQTRTKGNNCDLMPSQGQAASHIDHENSPKAIVSNINKLIKNIKIMRILFSPIDVIAENFPQIQTFVIFIELFIFMWLLYELSLLIEALCMVVKTICAPIIAIGKFMNRIV